jgi:hypothetical protein
MKTDDLIAALSTDLDPVPRRAVGRTLLLGLLAGGAASFVVMLLWLGPRPDMMPAMATAMFWMKLVYALSIALFGFALVDRLARPDGEPGPWRALLFAPLAVIAVMAMYRYATTPDAGRQALVMGSSWQVCAPRILILSIPVFVSVLWSLRALAPTRLVLAGLAAGILAGALGTFIYAFHCTESAAPFVAIWYTLGIAAVGVFGALLGRTALRW